MCQRDDRHLQLFGHELQPTGDPGNLLLTRCPLVFGLHQLQIVDNDRAQVVLPLQPPANRVDLRHVPPPLVIDEDRELREFLKGSHQQVVFMFCQFPLAERLHIQPASNADQSLGQFVPRHFEAENRDPFLAPLSNRVGKIEHESGFAHRWASGQDDQFGCLQAIGTGIQVPESGAHTADCPPQRHPMLDAGKSLDQHLL